MGVFKEIDNFKYKKGLPNVGENVLYNDDKCKVVSVDIFDRSYKIETLDGKVVEIKD